MTFEEAKKLMKQAGEGTENKSKGMTFEEAKQSVKQSSAQPTSQTPVSTEPQPQKAKGGFLGEILTGNTQRFGTTVGESINAPQAASKFAEASSRQSELENEIQTRLRTAPPEDVPRLNKALSMLQESKPEVEQFTGDVINKTNKQIAGEAGGTVLEAIGGGGLASKGIGVLSKTGKTLPKVAQIAGSGAIYGGAEGLSQSMQRDEGVEDNLSSTLKGGALGGALGAGGGLLGKLGSKAVNRSANKVDVDSVVGKILEPKDLESKDIVKTIARELDADNIKTFADNTKATDDYIKQLTDYKDTVLARNKKQIPLGELAIVQGKGGDAVRYNFVQDGLAQLYDQYGAIGKFSDQKRILNLAKKAQKQGLTRSEIEKIAREHGKELNAFNANGKLASGVTKQKIENIRSGLKQTSRELTNNPKVTERLKKVDKQIAKAIKYQKLSKKMELELEKFMSNKKKLGLIEKMSNRAANFINNVLLGAPGYALREFFQMSNRAKSFKSMNPIELEMALNKNIKLLQKINKTDNPSVIKKALDQLLKDVDLKTTTLKD